MYYAPHNHTVIAEHLVVDICKYKMWALTIKSYSCSTVPYDAPKSNNLTIRTLGWSKASSLHMLHCIYYAYVVVYVQCMLIMCSDAVLVHAVYVVLHLYYMLLIYPGKGNSYCRLLKTKLSIKSNLTISTHAMLLVVSRFTPPIYSKLLRIYWQDKHYVILQHILQHTTIRKWCNCERWTIAMWVTRSIAMYHEVVQLWKMSNCSANRPCYFILLHSHELGM